TAPGPSSKVQSLTALTTKVARARAITQADNAPSQETTEAADVLSETRQAMDEALEKAGKTSRLIKKKLGPSERISDASEDLALPLAAVSEARATNNFDASDLDEALRVLRSNLIQLAQTVLRSAGEPVGGLSWLRDVAGLPDPSA